MTHLRPRWPLNVSPIPARSGGRFDRLTVRTSPTPGPSLLPKRIGYSLTRGSMGKVCIRTQLTPRLRKSGAIPPLPLPHTPSCRWAEQSTGRTPAGPCVGCRNKQSTGCEMDGKYFVGQKTKKKKLRPRRRQENFKTNLQEVGRNGV
jgi:hypothetical protein